MLGRERESREHSRVDPPEEPPHHKAPIASRCPVTGLTHRQTEILNIARAYGRVMVDDLARRFEVSAQTIARTSTIFANVGCRC